MTNHTGSTPSIMEHTTSLTKESVSRNYKDYKTCSKCGEYRPLNQFAKNRGSKDGLNSRCTPCRNEYDKQRRSIPKYDITEIYRNGDHPDTVTVNYGVQHCYREELKRSQVENWALKGHIVLFGPSETISRKHLMWDEYLRLRYMAILVNRMAMDSGSASHVAGELMKCLVVQNGKTWVEHRGITIGVEIIKEQQ